MNNLIKGELKNYGLDLSQIIIENDQWQLGSIAPVILKTDGDWSGFLPIYEPQSNNNFDSYGCTCYGSLNQIETLLKFLEGKEYNYAERYPYNIVGINPPGANPHTVYECIRKNGLIPQAVLPMPLTLEDFKYPRPMIQSYLDMGKKWLEDYEFQHEWIMSPTQEDIAAALKYSPIAISVTAWFKQDDLYVDANQANTHWCLAFKAEKVNEGYILHVFDSYDHSIKKLHPGHKISFAKRIFILKKKEILRQMQEPQRHQNWLIEILINLKLWITGFIFWR